MDKQTFLKAVELYKSKGGNTTCSPNQSCEGETPDVVILKDFDGLPIAKVSLLSGEVERQLRVPRGPLENPVVGNPVVTSQPELINSIDEMAGAFCHAVAAMTLVGGLVGALIVASNPSGESYFGDRSLDEGDVLAISVFLGAAASSAPIFAIGSIANSTKRSAMIAQQMQMAEQEGQQRPAKPTPEPTS